jgi:hypothetical protein
MVVGVDVGEQNRAMRDHVERNLLALADHMDDGLPGLVANGHFVEGVGVVKAEVGDHQLDIMQPIDDLRTDHAWRGNLVDALDDPIGKLLSETRAG